LTETVMGLKVDVRRIKESLTTDRGVREKKPKPQRKKREGHEGDQKETDLRFRKCGGSECRL